MLYFSDTLNFKGCNKGRTRSLGDRMPVKNPSVEFFTTDRTKAVLLIFTFFWSIVLFIRFALVEAMGVTESGCVNDRGFMRARVRACVRVCFMEWLYVILEDHITIYIHLCL